MAGAAFGRWATVGLSLATALYLVFELSFNARLLDVAGGVPDASALDGVEFYGRLLSGVGAALLVGKLLVPRVRPLLRGGMVLVCIATSFAVFFGQRALVNALVEHSNGEQRKQAVLMTTLRWAAQKSAVEFPGLPLDDTSKLSPAGKTLFAVFPALFYSADKVQASVEQQLAAVVEGAARAQVGTRSEAYNGKFVPLSNDIRKLYNEQYVPAANKFAAVARAQSPDSAWNDYLNELEGRRIDPYDPSERQRKGVIQQLHKRGVAVPGDFRLADEAQFKASLPGANRTFASEASRLLGFKSTLVPGMSWGQFASHKDIQALAAQRLKARYPDLEFKGSVDLNAAEADFGRKVYEPLIADFVRQRVQGLTSSPQRYVTDPVLRRHGEDAVRSVLVPPLALGFSLFFGLLNLVGLVGSLVPSSAGKVIARLALAAALVAVPFFSANSVTSSPAFAVLQAELASRSTAQALGMRWLLGAEPLGYPLTNGVRMHILQDFKFTLR